MPEPEPASRAVTPLLHRAGTVGMDTNMNDSNQLHEVLVGLLHDGFVADAFSSRSVVLHQLVEIAIGHIQML